MISVASVRREVGRQQQCQKASIPVPVKSAEIPGPGAGLSRPVPHEYGVEEEAEGRVGLAAVLDGETEQHNVAGTVRNPDDCGPTGDRLFALQPAAQQEILLAVPGGSFDRSGRRRIAAVPRRRITRRNWLERRAEREKRRRFPFHAERQRLRRIQIETENRPRAEEPIFPLARNISNRQPER